MLRMPLFALPLSYTHSGIPRQHEDVTRPFSSFVNCESYSIDPRVVVFGIKRWMRVGAFPAKTSTCSWLFAARVGNELKRYHVM